MREIAAIVASEVVVQPKGGDIRILPQLVLDEEVHLSQSLFLALECCQLLQWQDITSLEDGLGSIIHDDVTVWTLLLAQKFQFHSELFLQFLL